ncbi:MAG TPA: hypothetical protein VFM50_02855 [Nocardioidaceae bacterium]|nr:hypothetical protein [Nocardioidaceae bacterium]
MAATTGVYVLRDAMVSVETVEYQNQCTRARLVPDTPIQQKRTLAPDGAVSDVDSPAWTFEVAALQKNDSGGLAKALRDATPGDELDVVLVPKDGSSMPNATFTILALPVVFGGDQGQWADFEAVFPVVGQPVFGTTSA